ncbi:unnamed protein product [Heligmosomoides polygyrus]|uniref:PEST proteolytic signal-containing nuclear protein n=1 Tax=Heligmosomoides polygyrus TaxID=6339 RepID=A0A3P8CPF6_HELPZ|nr:unnamed protein product [Heligmosomoides polygyrus]
MDSVAAAVDSTATQPKMLKLKLFGGKEKEKKDSVGTPVSSPAPTQQVQFRAPKIRPPAVTISGDFCEKNRTSKSSEEDSAYAGFGSTSPASSTQSSMSLQSSSSKGSHEIECQAEPVVEEKPSTPEPVVMRRGSDSQDKPMLAVKGVSSRLPPTAEKKEAEVEAETPKSDLPEAKKASLLSPTVGVVSPMLSQRRAESIAADSAKLKPAPAPVECEPSSSSRTAEKKAPPVPCRSGSRIETTFDCTPPAMAPIRQPPAYEQLVEQGRIQRSRLANIQTPGCPSNAWLMLSVDECAAGQLLRP